MTLSWQLPCYYFRNFPDLVIEHLCPLSCKDCCVVLTYTTIYMKKQNKTKKQQQINKHGGGGAGRRYYSHSTFNSSKNALSDSECLPLAVLGKLHNYLPSWTKLSADTFEQNKCFLAASFHNFKKQYFCRKPNPHLSPLSMVKYAPWTLSSGYNIEKGRGARNVKIGD